jgi:integrase/recombinase XerD
MSAPHPRPRQAKPLDAGVFQPEISSFRLHLAAEGKAAKTIRTYTEAVQWFAAAHLTEQAGRDYVL